MEIISILEVCHSSPVGGHHGGASTAHKILQCGYYLPFIYKDSNDYARAWDQCQRQGNISHKHELQITTILELELFDVGGIDFMGPFMSSHGMTYILVVVDYVSKWVEKIALPNNEGKSVIASQKKNIFMRFSMPRTIISDDDSHFCNHLFKTLLEKYGVKQKVIIPYHPQTIG